MRARLVPRLASVLLLASAPVFASGSLQIKVVEVFAGTEAAPDAQYVLLQMYAAGQNAVSGQSIHVYDSSGNELPNGVFTFGSDVLLGNDQTKILIATSTAETFFGVTADLSMSPVLPRAGGAVCFDAATGGANIDCVSWGGSITTSTSASGSGTPANSPIGIPPGRALKRRLDICMGTTTLEACDDTNDSSNDFVLGAPAPVNDAGFNGIPPASLCADGVLESLEGCDDANSADGDGCSSACLVEAGGFAAQGLVVDPAATATSNGNGVLEKHETAMLVTSWKNLDASPRPLLAGASSFAYPNSQIPDGNANFGLVASGATADCLSAGGDCYQVRADPVGGGVVHHFDYPFVEILGNGDTKTWKVHIGSSFDDVAVSLPSYRFIETIFHNGVTGGCGGPLVVFNFCPSTAVTRDQMAVFLLVSREGPGYVPPDCVVPAFTDVPCSDPFSKWVNELAARQVTAGCGGGMYCPSDPVTRAQMAVFLLRAREGSSYTPPACTTPPFADVPCSSSYARWIAELVARHVTAGCGNGNYCPNDPVLRSQMAVFLTVTFGLVLYGP